MGLIDLHSIKVKIMSKDLIETKVSLPEYTSPSGKESLRKNSYDVVKDALKKGAESESLKDKYLAIKIYESYHKIEEANTVLMLNTIMQASPEHIKIWEAMLKQNKAIDNIKSGKPTVQSVFDLPIPEKDQENN